MLGQVKTDEKSNEITAITCLLELLQISGCLVTIDAMGCQKEIAQKIIDSNAAYLLAVKDNQPTLASSIGFSTSPSAKTTAAYGPTTLAKTSPSFVTSH